MCRRVCVLFVLLAAAVCPAETLFVGVGIETYDEPTIQPLHYALADVNGLADSFRAAGVPEANVRILTSEMQGALRPNSGGIVRALGWARTRARAGDTLVFYFSGHGVIVDGQSYLLTVETSTEAIEDTSLPLATIRKQLAGFQGDHILLVIDACRTQPRKDKGGEAVEMSEQWAKDVRLRSLPPLQSKADVSTLLACDVGQRAFEWPDEGNSVFTYYLMQALKGAKDSLAADGTVRLSSLAPYLQREVEAWCGRARFPRQSPRLENPANADFVLYQRPRRGPETEAPTASGNCWLSALMPPPPSADYWGSPDPEAAARRERFEHARGRAFGLYSTYCSTERAFPQHWVESLAEAGRGALIFLEPELTHQDGVWRIDEKRLRTWCISAGTARAKILVVYLHEFNRLAPPLDPETFIDAYCRAADRFHRYAPNVELVWSFAADRRGMKAEEVEAYYPGDRYVDWVGLSLYAHRRQASPLTELLEPFKDAFGDKPLAIVETAAEADDPTSVARLDGLLRALPTRFPRVRLINYFDLDARRRPVRPKPIDYSLRPDTELAKVLSAAVAAPFYRGGPVPVKPLPPATSKIATRAEAFAALQRCLNLPAAGERVFPDLLLGHLATAPIQALAQAGVVEGYPDGLVRATWPISERELAIALNRALELRGKGPSADDAHDGNKMKYRTVPWDDWCYGAYLALGLVGNGGWPWDGEDGPDIFGPVTVRSLNQAIATLEKLLRG